VQESDNEKREAPHLFVSTEGHSQSLVWATKSVVMRNDASLSMDSRVVSPALYNSFQWSLLLRNATRPNFVIGVTSARPGDGKTLVAANLAISMAMGDERETVLVDLNIRRPRLHSVFTIGIRPGLAEALTAPMVHVARTTVRHLYVMTLGNINSTFSGLGHAHDADTRTNGKGNGKLHGGQIAEEVTSLPSFRNVLTSLKERFDVIIFDMPAISDPILPVSLTRQMDGMLFVVDSRTTTKTDIMRTSQRLGKDRILGFVLNRATESV
jgi:protein-tyrosine kinase